MRLALGVSLLGLVAGLGSVAVVLTSELEEARAATAALVLLTGWSFIGSGLVAWLRHPENDVGRLMVAVGFVSFFGALGEADRSLPFTIGVALGNASLALFAHLLLAFPTGTLRTRLRRVLAAAVYADLIGLQLAWLLVADVRETGCRDCVTGGIHEPAQLAENAALVWPDERLAQLVETVQNGAGAVLALAVAGVLAHRWRTSTAPARRTLAPVLLTGAVAAVLLVAALVTYVFLPDAADGVRWLALGAYTVVPLAFLAGILRGRLARSAVGSLVIDLGEARAAGELRDLLARALGDPALEVAYHVGDGRFVDREGSAVELPEPGSGRSATTVERRGQPVAVLLHDASLHDDQELVDAVTAATALALDNERLHAELRARLAELRRERDFLSTVAEVIPSVLCVVAPDGSIVGSNRAFEQLTGLTAAAVGERTLWDVLADPADAESARAALTGDDGGTLERESAWRGRDGRELRIAWSSTPIEDGEGRRRYLVSGVDVTDQVRHQEELRRSRARIVEAADAERRRVERSIHDGAQQHLAALALTLRLAEARLDEDPASARALVREASDELAGALAELSELARGIHPPMLAERGLRAALETVVSRARTEVELAAVPPGRLPLAIEVAAYYVVAESLANVDRHARASRAVVSVTAAEGSCLVEVRDDGAGGADPAGGSGLRGLADRVEALDGRLELRSWPGGGTVVRAELPYEPHP